MDMGSQVHFEVLRRPRIGFMATQRKAHQSVHQNWDSNHFPKAHLVPGKVGSNALKT